jgi:hypothetical protein
MYFGPFLALFLVRNFHRYEKDTKLIFRFSLDFLFSMSSSNVFSHLFIYFSRESTFV